MRGRLRWRFVHPAADAAAVALRLRRPGAASVSRRECRSSRPVVRAHVRRRRDAGPARPQRAAPAPTRAERLVADVDPLRYAAGAAPSLLFFQNGSRDTIVPRPALERLARAGSSPKRIRWYPGAGHGLNARAYREQIAWLSRRLRLDGVVVRGVDGGP